MPPSWIFGCAQPSETATSDLTGFGAANGGCCNDANWASSAMQPSGQFEAWTWCGAGEEGGVA